MNVRPLAAWRPHVAVLTVVATLAVMLVVASSTHGALVGSVILAGGCRDIASQGAPPISTCSSTPVDGAVVVISSADGVTINVHTDSQGRYGLFLPPDRYWVGAWVTGWRGTAADGSRGVPITGEATFSPVTVYRWGRTHRDIALAWYAT